MIEGLGILLTRATAPPPAPPMMDMAPTGAPLPQPGVSCALARLHASIMSESVFTIFLLTLLSLASRKYC